MNIYLYYAITLAVTIIVHELGHYIGFKYYGIKPKIYWHFGAITIGEFEMYELNSRQTVIVGLAGIFAGLIILEIFTNSTFIFMCYMIACSYDWVVIMNYLETWKNPKTICQIDTDKLRIIRKNIKNTSK